MKTLILSAVTAIRTRLGLVPTIESATAGIAKAVAQLDAVLIREEAEVEAARLAMEAARVRTVNAIGAADKAERIRIRLAALVE